MNQNKLQFDQEKLTHQNLLNISESRFYLNVSKRVFYNLEKYDPTFPRRKTATKHSRVLLDVWLNKNGSLYFEKPESKFYSELACRLALTLEQKN
jgi:hypothetical protein